MESNLKKVYDGKDIHLTPKSNHSETLIWLHGLGDSAEGFEPVFNSRMNPCLPTTKIVLLTAPIRKVTINGGMSCTSWYDIIAFRFEAENIDKAVSMKEVNESIERVHQVIEQEVKLLNGDYSKIAIGGFSQGCSISLSAGLNFTKTLGAILGFSGFLFPNVVESQENQNIPILVSHGRLDPLIPCVLAEKSYLKLDEKKHGLKKYIDENLDHGFGNYSLTWFKEFWASTFKK